jgi:hypothetical protein
MVVECLVTLAERVERYRDVLMPRDERDGTRRVGGKEGMSAAVIGARCHGNDSVDKH